MLLLLLSRLSCLTLCDPTDGSPPGSPVPGILHARTLEWGAIAFSNAWKWKGKVKSLSRVQLLATPWTTAHQAPPSMWFSRQEYWSGITNTKQTNRKSLYKSWSDSISNNHFSSNKNKINIWTIAISRWYSWPAKVDDSQIFSKKIEIPSSFLWVLIVSIQRVASDKF